MEEIDVHETVESATEAIEKYLEIKEIQEENTVINLQLDYCKDKPDTYSIDYTVQDGKERKFFTPTYTFKDPIRARKIYQDHVAAIETEFKKAEHRIMDPSLFTEAGKYGGNILI